MTLHGESKVADWRATNGHRAESAMDPAELPIRFAWVEQEVADIKADIGEIKTDMKSLLAAYNVGRGFSLTMRLGAAAVAAGAALATVWHYVTGHQ